MVLKKKIFRDRKTLNDFYVPAVIFLLLPRFFEWRTSRNSTQVAVTVLTPGGVFAVSLHFSFPLRAHITSLACLEEPRDTE